MMKMKKKKKKNPLTKLKCLNEVSKKIKISKKIKP